VSSNVANEDHLRDEQRETRTDKQNFVVCKKQLSSWNRFYGSGLGQRRRLRNFWAKGESARRGGLGDFIQKTPTDDHWTTLRKRQRGAEYDNEFLEIIIIIRPLPRNNYNNPAYLDKLCNK